MNTVLWVDDESEGRLVALYGILRRQKVDVWTARSVEEALDRMDELAAAKKLKMARLLLDVVLPRTRDGKAVSPSLGLELGRIAIERGVKRLCFLSVVRFDVVRDRIGELENELRKPERRGGAVLFVDKTALPLGGWPTVLSFCVENG